jgi:hypothetical protein
MIGQVIEPLITKVTEVLPCYTQLPLSNVDYPFAVITETISQTRPKFNSQIIVDIWDNKLNDSYATLDALARELYDFIIVNSKVFYWGKWAVIQNVPTQEEGLTRKQLRLEMKGYYGI